MSIFNRKPKPTETERGQVWWRDFAWEDIPHETVVRASIPVTAPTELVALKCSSCGANFSPIDRRCEYCGTWFVPQESPKSPTPAVYGHSVDYDVAVKGLSDSAKKMQATLDASAMADLLRASEKFKNLGLLSD